MMSTHETAGRELDGRLAEIEGRIAALEAAQGPTTPDPPPATPSDPPPTPPSGVLPAEAIKESYVGSFALPADWNPDNQDQRFGYSYGIHCQLWNGNLLVAGSSAKDSFSVNEVEITALSAEAPWPRGQFGHANWKSIPRWLLGDTSRPGKKVDLFYGILQDRHDSDLFGVCAGEWYATSMGDWPTLATWRRSENTIIQVRRQPEALHHNANKGGLCYPPDALVDVAKFCCGGNGSAGNSFTSMGPTLATASDAGGGKRLVYSDSETPFIDNLGTAFGAHHWVKASAIIETPEGSLALFAGHIPTGRTWYGNRTDVIDGEEVTDPIQGGKGYHSEGRALRLWGFDVADLVAAHNSPDPKAAEQVQSKWTVDLTEDEGWPFVHPAPVAAYDVAMSYRDGRLIMSEMYKHQGANHEPAPVFHVFDLL